MWSPWHLLLTWSRRVSRRWSQLRRHSRTQCSLLLGCISNQVPSRTLTTKRCGWFCWTRCTRRIVRWLTVTNHSLKELSSIGAYCTFAFRRKSGRLFMKISLMEKRTKPNARSNCLDFPWRSRCATECAKQIPTVPTHRKKIRGVKPVQVHDQVRQEVDWTTSYGGLDFWSAAIRDFPLWKLGWSGLWKVQFRNAACTWTCSDQEWCFFFVHVSGSWVWGEGPQTSPQHPARAHALTEHLDLHCTLTQKKKKTDQIDIFNTILFFLPSKFQENVFKMSYPQEASKRVTVRTSFKRNHWVSNVWPKFWPVVSRISGHSVFFYYNLGASSIFHRV